VDIAEVHWELITLVAPQVWAAKDAIAEQAIDNIHRDGVE